MESRSQKQNRPGAGEPGAAGCGATASSPIAVRPAGIAPGRRCVSVAAPSSAAHIPALDGLRGLAVLLVLLDHASDAGMRLSAGADLNRAGKYGVYLFFVLSAFLLTLPFCQDTGPNITSARMWLNYFLRRFLRIFPLYALVLLALIAMHKAEAQDFVTHLLLRDGHHQFWSIPVEVKYYLLLPMVGVTFVFLRRRAWDHALAAGVAGVAIACAIFSTERFWSLTDTVDLAKCLSPFLCGSAAAFVYATWIAPRASGGRFAVFFEVCAFLALGAVAVRIPYVYQHLSGIAVNKMANDPLVLGVIWSVMILGTLGGIGCMRRVLSSRPLRYLGLISYSAYLWHRKFLNDVDDLPVPIQLRLVAFLIIVIAVASVSYWLVERPLSRIRLRTV